MDRLFDIENLPEFFDAEMVSKFVLWILYQRCASEYFLYNSNIQEILRLSEKFAKDRYEKDTEHITLLCARIDCTKQINTVSKVCDDYECISCEFLKKNTMLDILVYYNPPNVSLHIVVMKAISFLIEKGAILDSYAHLLRAMRTSRISMFYFLIKQGANVNSVDRSGTPLLHWFPFALNRCKKKYTSYIEYVNKIHIFDTKSHSVVPLNISLSEILTEAKVDVNLRDRFGKSVLDIALENKDYSLFSFALNQGFDVHKENYGQRMIKRIDELIIEYEDSEAQLIILEQFKDILKEYVEGGGVATKSAKK